MCQDQTAKTPQISALANSKAALYFKNYRIPCQIRLSFKHTQTHTQTHTNTHIHTPHIPHTHNAPASRHIHPSTHAFLRVGEASPYASISLALNTPLPPPTIPMARSLLFIHTKIQTHSYFIPTLFILSKTFILNITFQSPQN